MIKIEEKNNVTLPTSPYAALEKVEAEKSVGTGGLFQDNFKKKKKKSAMRI